jgi:5'-nucleotidase
MAGSEIQTFTGRPLDPFAPDPEQIVVEDIAHALANTCRFGGHCRAFYSVAQHSCLLSDLMDGVAPRLWALLHDAAEAYLVDLPHPLKHRSELGTLFREVEDRLHAAILERFGLPPTPPPRLKSIDRALLAAEKRVLTAPGWEWPELEGAETIEVEIDPWTPPRAATEFLRRYEGLVASKGT